MNYLGIDYGEVNYGFAIGNSITKSSTTYFSEKIVSEKEALKFIDNLGKQKLVEQASLSSMRLPRAQQGQTQMKGFRVFVKIKKI